MRSTSSKYRILCLDSFDSRLKLIFSGYELGDVDRFDHFVICISPGSCMCIGIDLPERIVFGHHFI